jgi:hypothetical protein
MDKHRRCVREKFFLIKGSGGSLSSWFVLFRWLMIVRLLALDSLPKAGHSFSVRGTCLDRTNLV